MPSDDPDPDGGTDGGHDRAATGDGPERTDAADARSGSDARGARAAGGDHPDTREAAESTDVPSAPPERHTAGTNDGADRDTETPNTILNAVIGGVVTAAAVMFLGPFSPVVGGGVAGYLEGGETSDGLKVGAFAGLVALVPLVLFLPLLLVFVPVFGPRGGVTFLFVMVFGLSILGAYALGFSALGGTLGAYLKRER